MVLRMVLMGPNGVGKGTYGKLLAKKFGISLIGSGELVREEIGKRTEKGKMLEEYAAKGLLVPDQVIVDIVENGIEKVKLGGFILDGFPRTRHQAEILDKHVKLNLAVSLNLKREEYLIAKMLGRRICSSKDCTKSFNVTDVINEEEGVHMPALLPSHMDPNKCECGAPLTTRKDDTEQVIRDRLDIYKKETIPVIDFYREKGILTEFVILRGLDDMPKLEKIVEQHI